LLFLSGGENRFVLICSPLAFQTALRSPLIGPDNLFDLFSKHCNYFSTVLVWFGFTVGEPTPFFLIKIDHFFFLLYQNWELSSFVTFFLIQLTKKKKKKKEEEERKIDFMIAARVKGRALLEENE